MRILCASAALIVALAATVTSRSARADGEEKLTKEQVAATMKRAATFYRTQVATHGGYVYFYSVDLQQRFGEGVATADQIWVQPPGTPTVGMAYLAAFDATADRFYLEAATEAANALIYGQLMSGGWANVIDFNPSGQRVALYRNGKGRGRNVSSLDDDQSQSAIRFLMRCDRAHAFQNEAIHNAVRIALQALLAAQFNNGAFPQGWTRPSAQIHPILSARFPSYDWRTDGRIKNYWDMYTLNDDLASSVSRVLLEAHENYGQERYRESLIRLGDFLLRAQLPEPQPAWSQQYSYDMLPIWARKFEPPAVAGRESQDVLKTLLTLFEVTGERRFLEPVPRAIAYLKRSLLNDQQLARYYELRTNRPLYMKRRGSDYLLTYDDSDLPDHYGWKTASRIDAIESRFRMLLEHPTGAPLSLTGRPSRNGQSESDLTGLVRRASDSLDPQGRWISTYNGERLVGDQKFRPGDRYLSSEVFSRNLEVLSEHLTSSK